VLYNAIAGQNQRGGWKRFSDGLFAFAMTLGAGLTRSQRVGHPH